MQCVVTACGSRRWPLRKKIENERTKRRTAVVAGNPKEFNYGLGFKEFLKECAHEIFPDLGP